LLVLGLLGTLAPDAQATSASGGMVSSYTQNGTNWTAHIYSNVGSTSLVFSVGGNVEVLIVAGGGGGTTGYGSAGGGGAGGRTSTATAPTAGTPNTGGGGGGNSETLHRNLTSALPD
jgi:hypothetical protein